MKPSLVLCSMLFATSAFAQPQPPRAPTVLWQGAPVTSAPRWTPKISSRKLDPAATAKLKSIGRIAPLTPEVAGRILAKKQVGAWSFVAKLGPYEGTRTQVERDKIHFDVCLDFLKPLNMVSIVQQYARSGYVEMGTGSEAHLHLPAMGTWAVVRFTVDGSSRWAVGGDGLKDSTVELKAVTADAAGTIELGVELGTGGPGKYTTIKLRPLASAQIYNVEIAMADYK